MDERLVYIKNARAQIDEIKADLQKMRAKAKQMEADGQLAYIKKIKDFESERKRLAAVLSEIMKHGIDATRDIKNAFEKAWDSLKYSIESARMRFEEG